MTTRDFVVEQYGVAGKYPDSWLVPEYSVTTNTVLELVQGADTYFDLGYIPKARRRIAEAQPNLSGQEIDDIILGHAASSLVESESYFRGTTKTTLSAGRIRFGDHQVIVVTQLIERPIGVMAEIPPADREGFLTSQFHYLTLCPEGATRIARQFAWVLGDDIWTAQVVAPPETFLQRVTEVEEIVLPSLNWAEKKYDSPSE